MAKTIPLKQRAYKTIQRRILTGRHGPGELLNRRGIAAELGMSSAPVHEAMLQLERDGLLEALPRIGTRVRTASRDDVRGQLIVREALECQAARLICGEPIARNRERLFPLADVLDALEPLDPKSAEQEITFHCALVKLADCPSLLLEYQRVMQIGLFYRIHLAMNIVPEVPKDLHRALVTKLAAADPETADKLVRQHIRYGKPVMLRPVTNNGILEDAPSGVQHKADRLPSNHGKQKRATTKRTNVS